MQSYLVVLAQAGIQRPNLDIGNWISVRSEMTGEGGGTDV
jgi:hypothetical protein